MNQFFRSSAELVGEFTGLRTRDWQAVRQAQYEGVKSDIVRASGLVGMVALKNGDLESSQLERKIFLHDIAFPAGAGTVDTMSQQAAQEVLDELYIPLQGE